MPRLMLSDELWPKLLEILLQESLYNKCNLRVTVEGMLYRMRTGCPWRDLPPAFLGQDLQAFQCLVGVRQVVQGA